MSTDEVQAVVDEVPPPPLKKRATKRGLSKTLSAPPADEEHAVKTSHVTSVYSSCVMRSSMSLPAFSRKPLFSKQDNSDTQQLTDLPTSPCPKKELCTKKEPQAIACLPTEPVTSIFIDDDTDEEENSILSTDDVGVVRAESPPVPPPPPVTFRGKPKRISKGIKNALKTLNSMKGELRKDKLTSPSTPSVVICEDSPVQSGSQVVRIRHINDIHRFSMTKTDMYYSLQQQMAQVLNVDVDQIGLYLNDHRLSPSDTPQSTKLHLADIIVCHVLVSGESGNGAVDSESIRVLMQCTNSRQNCHAEVKKYLPFEEMFENYAKTRGMPAKSFKFYFDGELLTGDMLPSAVDLDADDTIDVVEVK